MPSDTRQTTKRTFSIAVEVSEDIDQHATKNNLSKSKVVEIAVSDFLKESQADRIEGKIDTLLDKADGECSSPSPPSQNESTHTQTQTESDGGVSVQSNPAPSPNSDPAKITSFDEYKPELPEDYELTSECLESAPEAVADGQVINDDHVEYDHLQSRGVSVRIKTAVCAGIIRYHNQGDMRAKEDHIKNLAADALGSKRNARRHFDEIVSYFYEGPEDHPEVGDVDALSRDNAREMCAQEGIYALTFEAIDEPYWRYESKESIERATKPVGSEDPDKYELLASFNTLGSIAREPDQYVPYLAQDIDELERVYSNLKSRVMPMVQVEYDDADLPEGFDNVE